MTKAEKEDNKVKNPMKQILNFLKNIYLQNKDKIDRIIQEHEEEKANKYNCKNCIHYGNFEAFYGEVYACELYGCHYKRKEVSK